MSCRDLIRSTTYLDLSCFVKLLHIPPWNILSQFGYYIHHAGESFILFQSFILATFTISEACTTHSLWGSSILENLTLIDDICFAEIVSLCTIRHSILYEGRTFLGLVFGMFPHWLPRFHSLQNGRNFVRPQVFGKIARF